MVEVGQESPWSHGHQHGTLSAKLHVNLSPFPTIKA